MHILVSSCVLLFIQLKQTVNGLFSDSTQTPYIELPSTVIGPVRINRLLFDDLRSWTGRHPVVTTIVAVPLVAIAAYYIYRKFM